MPYTVVSFHAHPDDEALLTAGTLARAAAEGHRVVLVTATDGAAGLAAGDRSTGPALAERRTAELRRAGVAIGCLDVRLLGYADSGMDGKGTEDGEGAVGGEGGEPGRSFAGADVEEAARRLAAILTETGADVLTVYDPAGGYGHPDHVQVHRVGTRAALLAGTPVVLEATVDRRPLVRVLKVLERSGVLRVLKVDRGEWSSARFEAAFADPSLITHKVDVRGYTGAKRAAMVAHASQATSDSGVRTLAVFLRLPSFVFDRVFAHEWFVEHGRSSGARPLDDIFDSLAATIGGDRPREVGPR